MGFSSSQVAQASVASQIGGTLASTIGGFYSASTQKRSLQSEARIAEINANIAELGAESALLQGQSEIGRLTLQAGQLKGRQRAVMAASGIDLGTGNAAEIQASTELMKEIDKETIQTNAARAAWGYRTQSMNFRNQAAFSRATARGINPGAGAITSLISGATSVASSWYGFQKEGAFGATAQPDGTMKNNWW